MFFIWLQVLRTTEYADCCVVYFETFSAMSFRQKRFLLFFLLRERKWKYDFNKKLGGKRNFVLARPPLSLKSGSPQYFSRFHRWATDSFGWPKPFSRRGRCRENDFQRRRKATFVGVVVDNSDGDDDIDNKKLAEPGRQTELAPKSGFWLEL